MNEERQTLPAFLEHQQFRYRNPAGVIFYRMADGSLYVVSRYPGVEQTTRISLEFFQHFAHLTQFMALLHFSDPKRLADVVPQDLLSLYEDELLEIVCTLKSKKGREMSFRKLGGIIWASNTKKKMHQVHIDKPEDFISYTIGYYKVIDN